MPRQSGWYKITSTHAEEVRAFVPEPLPPRKPPLELTPRRNRLLGEAESALARLEVAGKLVPSLDWFLYGFVRKEALISSQIEGTQATLQDVVTYEATGKSDRPADIEDVCNYVAALEYCRREIRRPKGLPLSTRLLCEAHKRLLRGVRGGVKEPGRIRVSQNWVGGSRPGKAFFVPPPPEEVPECLATLERWIHEEDPLPPLVRAGLAHVQFETIHPFLDGNGRIGRMLITLLVEHWGLLSSPLLYLSLALKQRRDEYYARLTAVRTEGDFEGWIDFYLECVQVAAIDACESAQSIFAQVDKDRRRLVGLERATIPAVRLFEQLPNHPNLTLNTAIELLDTSKPTAAKAIELLEAAKILREITGKQRDRVYSYHKYLKLLSPDTEPISPS